MAREQTASEQSMSPSFSNLRHQALTSEAFTKCSGHVPFDLDITDALHGSSVEEATTQHRLTVRVYDSAYDLTQPRGKQYWGPKPESIFYTPSSGIWQSVWLESVPPLRIADSSHGVLLAGFLQGRNGRCR